MTRLALILTSALALALSACSGGDDDAGPVDDSSIAVATNSANLIEVAQGDSELSQLAQAIADAGLGETLAGEGPFTILAPTDAAFAALADEGALAAGGGEQLRAVLEGHVVEGRLDYAALSAAIEEAGDDGHTITTLGGGAVTASLQEGAIVLTSATGRTASISAVDVEASNGLIHIIDAVLLP
ncbi:fasciclin domain-containing protein [uncultured Erythrobacter sp.]|uniref:fasciclin domain-containing protein n=1 Tax=uncultured Erythrobacter sp. TaxID=263913 RepID=UPI0026317F10|nr:fasciclin domain-containing protein [uncultured Erythrobacter sp.]